LHNYAIRNDVHVKNTADHYQSSEKNDRTRAVIQYRIEISHIHKKLVRQVSKTY